MPKLIDHDARKAELAEALWRVIVKHGIGAVSVRTVATEAGVSVGSLRHIFPSRSELLAYSAELMVQRATDRFRATKPVGDPREDALALLLHLLPLHDDSRAEFNVNIGLIAESRALPELAEITQDAYSKVFEVCVSIISDLTGRDPDAQLLPRARRLHALIDGLALHLSMQPADTDPDWAIALLRREVDTLAERGVAGD